MGYHDSKPNFELGGLTPNGEKATSEATTESLETKPTEVDETGGEQLQNAGDDNQDAKDNGDLGTTEDDAEDNQGVNESTQPKVSEDDVTDSTGEQQDAIATVSTDGTPVTRVKKNGEEPAARKTNKERRKELILLTLAIAAGLPEGGIFDALRFAEDHRLALSLVRDIFLEAQDHFDKLVKYKGKPEKKILTISKKSNLMLKIDDIEELNMTRDGSEHFKIGDKFEHTSEGDKIILTRISCSA